MNEKYPGDTITKIFTFTDEDDEPFDPDTITLDVKGPDGVIVESFDIGDFEHEVLEVGIYTFTYPIPSDADAGTWTFELTVTQTVSEKQNKESFEFEVLAPRQHYGNFERVKRLCNIIPDNMANDDVIEDALVDADRYINDALIEQGLTVPVTTIAGTLRTAAEYMAAGAVLQNASLDKKMHPYSEKGEWLLREYMMRTSAVSPLIILNDDS